MELRKDPLKNEHEVRSQRDGGGRVRAYFLELVVREELDLLLLAVVLVHV